MTILSVPELRSADDAVRTPAAPRLWGRPWWWLSAFALVSCGLSLRPGTNTTPFQDEGLYLFMGHRMIDHLLHGAHLSEYPGAYFSGGPGAYPPIAAVVDSVGGLTGARILSEVFIIVAMIAVYSSAALLFGEVAGVIGAGAFVLCGSIIFVSHLATFDAMAIALLALALWLSVYSGLRDGFLWAPVVGVLLALAFLTKYATAVYAPGIALIGAILAFGTVRWAGLVRAALAVGAAIAIVLFVLTMWGQELIAGIRSTTAQRTPLAPQPPLSMGEDVLRWVGPWLLFAVLGAVAQRRRLPLVAVLLFLSVIGPLQQMRIHESVSLSKHAGFGMLFAAPLIGAAGVWLLSRTRVLGSAVLVAAAGWLAYCGVVTSTNFMTGWVDDRPLVAELRRELQVEPGKAILGEEPSAQRYALRTVTDPDQWTDTYGFSYAGKTGIAAYDEAIDQSHFGIIYLTLNTEIGKEINQYLTDSDSPYRLTAKVPSYRRGEFAGYFLIWMPKAVQ